MYQHFRTSEVQWWYKCEQERRKKEGEKNKYFQKKYCDRFKNRYVPMYVLYINEKTKNNMFDLKLTAKGHFDYLHIEAQ